MATQNQQGVCPICLQEGIYITVERNAVICQRIRSYIGLLDKCLFFYSLTAWTAKPMQIKNKTQQDWEYMMLWFKSKPVHGILKLSSPEKLLFSLKSQPQVCSVMFTHPLLLTLLSADTHKAHRQSISFPPSCQCTAIVDCHQLIHQPM